MKQSINPEVFEEIRRFMRQSAGIQIGNVLIYFDQSTKIQVLRHLIESPSPGGWLMTGHCESLHGLDLPLQLVSPSVFRLSPPAAHRVNA